MDWGFTLRIAVWLAGALSLTALIVIVVRTARYGRPYLYSQAGGRPLSGVVYAFGKGMMPWEKESVARHLWTFTAGVLYHLGILLAFVQLFMHLLAASLPQSLRLPLHAGLLVGLGCGLALLGKRLFKKTLRCLSCADDFLANLLVDIFLALSLLFSWGRISEVPWLAAATVLLLYIPAGKIRHCCFFFYTRTLFGLFFGRRGVYPGPGRRVNHG